MSCALIKHAFLTMQSECVQCLIYIITWDITLPKSQYGVSARIPSTCTCTIITKGSYHVNLLGTPWQDAPWVEGIVNSRRGTEPHGKQFSLAMGSPRMCLQLGELSSSETCIFTGSCSLALFLSSSWRVMGKGWPASTSEQWRPYSQTGWNLKVSLSADSN